MWVTRALLVALMLGMSSIAVATSESGKSDQMPKFSEVDQNGNSKLSFQEAKAAGIDKETFNEEDLDEDGKLTKYDYKYGVK